MKQNKIWTIIKHEYFLKVKSRGFIIGTILAPLGIIAFMGIIAAITYFSVTNENKDVKVLINDKTNKVATNIIKTDTTKYFLSSDNFDILKSKVLHNDVQAAVFLDTDAISTGNARIFVNEQSGLNFLDKLRNSITNEIRNVRLLESGINQEILNQIYSDANIQTDKITDEGTVKDDTEIKTIISYIMGFAIYFMMILYGTQVMQGVIEEKQNRIVEVLASSASPFEIMFGKVVGVGAVGLTQVLIWIVLIIGMMFFAGNIFTSPEQMNDMMDTMQSVGMRSDANTGMVSILQNIGIPSITVWHILGFIFYFLSGYFIFATLFAAVGSTVDQMQDANSMATPLTLIIIVPMAMISPTVLNPESIYIAIFSLFPFFAPILMVARIMSINIPIWQVLLSIFLQFGTFLLCLKIAGKIYRSGMLRYGKKASFKEVFNWLKIK
jgi:ABC-2 type transport system permease protein